MRLFGRRDSVLIIGLAVALSVIFTLRIRDQLDVARVAGQTYGPALIPGLIILTLVFLLHQLGKRQESRAERVASASAAREAEARARDLEPLIRFGQSLARSLDLDSIRNVLLQHLPHLAGTSDAWVMVRAETGWQSLLMMSTRSGRREIDACELAAEQALAEDPAKGFEADGTLSIEVEGQIVFPLMASGAPIGALGVPKTVILTGAQRRVLAAASALLAVSVKNVELFRETRENSLCDGLTGCFNRAHGIEMTDTELRRARRSHVPLSVIMFDIDHFKAINDEHGHLCGDTVLSAVGRRMKDVLRGGDVRCRYGGEEFLVVLPGTPLEGARRVAEILRNDIAGAPLKWNGEEVRISASFGVTVAQPSEVDTPVVIARADSALYRAKSDGRNCVRVAADSMAV